MNVVNKNEGVKIPYVVVGDKITFKDELTLDLSKYERDYQVNLDVCNNKDNILIIGLSEYYVAQLEIPERKYTEIIQEDETIRVPQPFNIDDVTLILWAIVGGVA